MRCALDVEYLEGSHRHVNYPSLGSVIYPSPTVVRPASTWCDGGVHGVLSQLCSVSLSQGPTRTRGQRWVAGLHRPVRTLTGPGIDKSLDHRLVVQVAKEIETRTKHERGQWGRPLMLFPEGTTTNGTARESFAYQPIETYHA